MNKEKLSYWTEIMKTWQGSGKRIVEYCRENNIPQWKFYYWKKRVLSPEKEGAFTKLSFSDERELSSGLWIELSPGVRLVITKGFSSRELYRVLQAARGRKC